MLIDPYDRAYRYAFSELWAAPRSYVCYSIGPDGAELAPDFATGDPLFENNANLDNVYAARE